MKWLLRIFLSLMCLIAIIAGAAVTVWMNPSLVLTDARVNTLFTKYAGSLFSKPPEGLKLKLEPFGFWGKRIHVEAANFCLIVPEACFKSVKIDLAVKLLTFTKVKVEEVGPIEILGETFRYKIEQAKKEEPKTDDSGGSLFDHIEIPLNALVKEAVIDLPKVQIVQGAQIIDGSLNLNGRSIQQVTLTVNAASNEGLKASVLVHTAFDPDQESPFDAQIRFKASGNFNGDLKGKINWIKLEGALAGSVEVSNLLPWLNTLYVKNLKIDRHHGKSNLSADLESKLDQRLAANHSQSVMPKLRLDTFLGGKLSATEAEGDIQYQLKLGPTKDKGLVFQALVGGVVPFPKGEAYRYGIDRLWVTLEIPIFKNFVESLRRTNYSVPAPFSAMNGSVTLRVGKDENEFHSDTIPARFETKLDSTEQVLKTESEGTIQFLEHPQKIKISGESRINQFKFTLPSIKVLEPAPLMKNDPRLISSGSVKQLKVAKAHPTATPEAKGAGSAASESMVDLDWKISTAPSGIQIYHSVLKPYAPVEVTWDIGKSSYGSIELKPFEIEYLKHGAKVKFLKLYQKPNDTQLRYEGKLEVKKTDYTIYIDIIQDGDAPKIVMTSDPILDQADIISVLLFNQTTAELDSTDQTNSVASTQSAVTSRALGLFSILALSSTPVEAVNFNPTTGVYSARVKLANGLTATVGTDWDQNQQVALRKRLGKNFVLSAIEQIDPQTNNEVRETLIQWFKRFK